MYSILDQMLGGEFFSHELPIRRTEELMCAEKKQKDIRKRLESELGEGGFEKLDEFCSAKNMCDFLIYSQTEKDMFCLGALLMLEITTRAHRVLESTTNTGTSCAEN